MVATYMYMRLCGYPAERITILATYNGQKMLLRDVLNERCGRHPLFGLPARVTTVDKYQGQQNDYVLLSLVGPPRVSLKRALDCTVDPWRAALARDVQLWWLFLLFVAVVLLRLLAIQAIA